MTLKQDNLKDLFGMGKGNTTNFSVWYEDSLPNNNTDVVVANANALLAVIENEFSITTGWFNTPTGKFGTGNRQEVDLNRDATPTFFPGAGNNGYGNPTIPISLDAQNITGDAATAGRVEMVFIAEWVEVLMSIAGNWNAVDSSGEGLSQFCTIQRFQTGHYNYYSSWVENWLNGTGKTNLGKPSPNAARSDWITKTFTGVSTADGFVHGDGDPISFGCALAFLYYLNVQLSFNINQIIAKYSFNMASIYQALTGDPGNPFPFFLNLISSFYPSSSTASIPGPVSDNPFPIAIVSFSGNKNTFGLDESKDIINNQGGLVSGAFLVMVDGFSKQSFNALNITANNNFSGDFFNLPGVQISPKPPQFQAGVNDTTPQRISIPCDITLSTPILTQNPGTYTLTVSLTSNGNPVNGGVASMQFELLAGADPYFSNIDVNLDNQPYLSQDLRVFTATPAQKGGIPIPGGPTLSDSIDGAYQYIKELLAYLNSNSAPSFTDPKGTDPFTSIFPDQYGANQTDSSVTPFTLDLGAFPFPKLDNNYNFAVARVRLQGSSGLKATNVRVFFRLFSAQSNDTDYDINSTYPSSPDAAGKPGSPLIGSGNTTIPFFATGNFSSQQDYVSGGPNIYDIEIPPNQDGVYHYYGCFLDVYNQNYFINGQPIQALLNATTHHCLVAQIAYDDAPIPQGASPLSWDQLAQRNLQVTPSDNPGSAASHRIPQAFDCRPSGAIIPPGGNQLPVPPDELMIDWGTVPSGSVASIYWPQVNATDVINLASQFYSSNPLTVSDSHTIKLIVTEGLSYIPIPSGAGQNFAGLFTIDLPPGKVSTGQIFNVVVRRLSSKTYTPPPPLPIPHTPHTMPSHFSEVLHEGKSENTPPVKKEIPKEPKHPLSEIPSGAFSWRYVVGSFIVQIPVMTGDKILFSEENTLAIMKWRLQQMVPSDRWYPVLERYISYIAGRVDGLGGNSSCILPSPTGVLPCWPDDHVCFVGKISGLIYDHFGDFEGFILETDDCRKLEFSSRESHVEEIVRRSCLERLRITVFSSKCDEHCVKRIVLHPKEHRHEEHCHEEHCHEEHHREEHHHEEHHHEEHHHEEHHREEHQK
jgi:hypothetical protein